jgi:hypothetical protein
MVRSHIKRRIFDVFSIVTLFWCRNSPNPLGHFAFRAGLYSEFLGFAGKPFSFFLVTSDARLWRSEVDSPSKRAFPWAKGTWLYWISSPIVEEQIGSHLHVSSFVGLVATRTPTYLYGNKANDKAKVADSYR